MSLVKSANPAAQSSEPFQFVGRSSTKALRQETAPTDHPDPSEDTHASKLCSTRPPAEPAKSIARGSCLLARIEELENTLKVQSKELQAAKSKAYEDGVKAGSEASQVQSQEALALLSKALEGCSTTLSAELDGQIEASLALAQAIVQRVLGDTERLPEHVLKAALRWKDELAAASIIELRVSATDFPDSEALAELQTAFSTFQVVAEMDLDQGACVFDLKLGNLDASIPRQVQNAAAFLEAAAAKGGTA